MWGAMLARVLTSCNITVILPDYRNYPWGNVKQAVSDVRSALEYTKEHYPNRPIIAVGQSAGSHLLLTLFLREYIRLQLPSPQSGFLVEEAGAETDHDTHDALPSSSSLLDNVHGLIALSGPLDLNAMRTTFHKFGLDRNFVERIFGCSARPSSNNHNNDNDDLAAYDPMLLLDRIGHIATNDDDDDGNDARPPNKKLYFPPLHLYHGMADTTVPVAVAQAFVVKWRRQTDILANRLEKVQFYDGYSHTDPILEGPADGDHLFHRDVYDAVQSWTTAVVPTTTTTTPPPSSSSWPDESSDHPILRPLSYHWLVQLARFFMPF
jgi:acetyl esterase/lipase